MKTDFPKLTDHRAQNAKIAFEEVEPAFLRPEFRTVFRCLQRGKKLESMTLLDGHYLLSGDGTGFYSSAKVASPYCLKKTQRNGVELYYQQMYAATLVHQDCREVITFFPEMITRQDGSDKNECERNASCRFFEDLRRRLAERHFSASNGKHQRALLFATR